MLQLVAGPQKIVAVTLLLANKKNKTSLKPATGGNAFFDMF